MTVGLITDRATTTAVLMFSALVYFSYDTEFALPVSRIADDALPPW